MLLSSHSRIAVVGTGAIGGYLGTLLVHSGRDVHFLMRSDYEIVQQQGMVLSFSDRPDLVVPRLNCYLTTGAIGVVDVVIVALKTTANEVLKELLPPLVGPHTLILTLQNGLGNMEFLQQLFPQNHILGGLCFIGVTRREPGHLQIFSRKFGSIVLGEVAGAPGFAVNTIVNWFARAGFHCKALPAMEEALWRKLVWNIPFNGLSIVAGGISTDKVLADPTLSARARMLMHEIQTAAAAYGIHITDEDIDRQFPFTERLDAYFPSSTLDFLNGRPVELQTMFAEPLRRGMARSVPMPELDLLYRELQQVCLNS
ncbi:MAG: 2-dehydropantoate 2-reductase [Opitutales bacterium]|nr:2-dehydropantoate 2-reductase [Opitutales bacterium]